MEDAYEQSPLGSIKLEAGEDVRFKTDDPVVNKWEEQYARGEMPDFDEILTPEETAKLEAQAKEHDEGFADSYDAVDEKIDKGLKGSDS